MAEVKKGEAGLSKGQKAESVNAVFEEFFQDYFNRRKNIYWLNFVRGIFFGLGTVIGGTFVLAAVLWLLSFFQQIPFLSEVVEAILRSIEDAKLR